MKSYLFLFRKNVLSIVLLLIFMVSYVQAQVISGNETWNSKRILDKDVVVPDGSVLTIENTTINLYPNVKIVVECGGTLNLNSSTLTSLTTNSLWDGIEVRGARELDLAVRTPGCVNATKTTISNSIFGICAGRISGYAIKYDVPGKPLFPIIDYNYCGGKIIANECSFINNYQSASIYSYQSTISSYNVSKFTKCTFDMNKGSLIDAFVRLKNVYGVGFYGCTFGVSFSSIELGFSTPMEWHDFLKSYRGIYATNSAFTVTNDDGLVTSPISSRFYNLGCGIYVEGTAGTATPKVTFTEFNGVLKGIYAGATNNMFVQDCVFYVPIRFDNDGILHYGIYLDYSTNFVIENNYFLGYVIFYEPGMSSPELSTLSYEPGMTNAEKVPAAYPFGTSGVFVNESGEVANEIYGNRFERLKYAVTAQGVNVSHDGSGLCFTCNEFVKNNNDISVWHAAIPMRCDGIALNQKNGTKPAGNTFSKETEYDFHEFDIYNDCQLFYYYCYQFNTVYDKLIPTLKSDKVKVYSDYMFNFDRNRDCPRKLRRASILAESELPYIRLGIETLQDQLISSIDGGDSETMLNEVDNATAGDATTLREMLMDNSPYLSNETVKAAAVNEDAVNNTTLRDVLVGNRKAIIDEAVMEVVANRSNPLPSYMYSQIEQAKDIENERDALEAQIQYQKLDYSSTFAGLAEDYISNGEIEKWGNLMKGSINTDNQYSVAIHSKLTEDDSAESNAIMAMLSAKIGDNERLQAEHDAYIDYLSVVTNDVVNGIVNEEEKEILMGLSESNTKAGLMARLILQNAGELRYEEPFCIPLSNNDMKHSVIAKGNTTDRVTEKLSLQPNPAKGSVVVEYDARGCSQDLVLTITDMQGNVQHSEKLQYQEDSKYVNIDRLVPGIYIVNILSEGNIVYTNKLTIK